MNKSQGIYLNSITKYGIVSTIIIIILKLAEVESSSILTVNLGDIIPILYMNLAICVYGLNTNKAALLFLLSGLSDLWINKNQTAELRITITLLMIVIVLCRLNYRKRKGIITFPLNVADRFSYIIDCELRPFKIDILYNLIIASTVVCIIMKLADPTSATTNLRNTALSMMPYLTLFIAAVNLDSAKYYWVGTFMLYAISDFQLFLVYLDQAFLSEAFIYLTLIMTIGFSEIYTDEILETNYGERLH